MKVITVVSQKGGASKSTLSICLANLLAEEHGKKVLLIDADPQEASSHRTWEKRSENANFPPLYDSVKMPVELDAEELYDTRDTYAAHGYDFVVIDCPPCSEGTPMATRNRFAILAADYVLVPINPSPMDFLSLDRMGEWIATAGKLREDTEQPPLVAKVVVVRFNARINDMKEVRGLIDERFPLAETTIGERRAFRASILANMSLFQFEPCGKAAQEVRALATEFGIVPPLYTDVPAANEVAA